MMFPSKTYTINMRLIFSKEAERKHREAVQQKSKAARFLHASIEALYEETAGCLADARTDVDQEVIEGEMRVGLQRVEVEASITATQEKLNELANAKQLLLEQIEESTKLLAETQAAEDKEKLELKDGTDRIETVNIMADQVRQISLSQGALTC
jgi:hypothetical protein